MSEHRLRQLAAVSCVAAVISLAVACILAAVLMFTKDDVKDNRARIDNGRRDVQAV